MEPKYLPLGRAAACDIRNLKQGGLLLPARRHDEPLIVTVWDGATYGIVLSGDHAFVSFQVSLQSPHTGLFLPEPEILVDMSSVVDAARRTEEEGLLVLAGSALSVVATPSGNRFAGPQMVPLWQTAEQESEVAMVGFPKWSIGVAVADGYHVLWERIVTE